MLSDDYDFRMYKKRKTRACNNISGGTFLKIHSEYSSNGENVK
jgi:hypothetical protein